MGISIIWILLFHHNIRFDLCENIPGIMSGFVSFLLNMGSVGVELFLLCSGFGLCFSIKKCGSFPRFYLRRAVRLIPEYCIALILTEIVLGFSFVNLVLQALTVRFYISSDFYAWFMSLIVLLYLLFPFVYKLLTDSEGKIIKLHASVLLLIFILLSLIFHLFFYNYDDRLCMVFDRIPIFIIGVIIGILYEPGKDFVNKKNITVISLVFVLSVCLYYLYVNGFVFPDNNLRYFLYLPLSLSLAGLLIFVLKNIKTKLVIIDYAGRISLSLYLSDCIMEQLLYKMRGNGHLTTNNPLAWLLAVVMLGIMINAGSELIRKAAAKLNKRFEKNRNTSCI